MSGAIDDPELLEIFSAEARELVGRLARALMQHEAAADGAESMERVHEAFRLAHSLKGAAGAVNRPDLIELAHGLESCLDSVRRAGTPPDRALYDACLSAVDILEGGLDRMLAADEVRRTCDLLHTAGGVHGGADAAPAPSAAVGAADDAASSVASLLSSLAALSAKSSPAQLARVAAAFGQLSARGEWAARPRAARVVRAVSEVLTRGTSVGTLSQREVQTTMTALDFLSTELAGLGSDEEAEVVMGLLGPADAPTAPAPAPAPRPAPAMRAAEAASIRIPVGVLDRIGHRVDELTTTRMRLDYHRQQLEELQEWLASPDAVDADRIDRQRRRLESLRQSLAQDSHTLSILGYELQQDLKEVRMVPVAALWDSLRRQVRTLAQELGKEAVLDASGDEVRVDKRLLELMTDPLTHLVRNALDHGVEPPEERARLGKPRVARVRLSAESREAQLWLELSDDGRGIDHAAVRQRAVARGLVEPERAQALSEAAAVELIFLPGFTTANAVSELSGRGVGLDVVRTNVAALGGRVDVHSTPGEGTRFSVGLPLTVTGARGVFVGVGKAVYCLPLLAVEEAFAIDPSQVVSVQGRLALRRRDAILPFAPLADLLAARAPSVPRGHGFAVVLVSSERRVAIGVDELLGQEEVVVRAVAGGAPPLRLLSGATFLADGRLVSVLDPAAVLRTQDGAARPAPALAAPRHHANILLADDTLTSRMMVASVLDRAGYRTFLAHDGDSALALLERERVDLLVSDVEMPGMSGFELIERIRRDPRWRDLPAVLLTSLGAPEDRARGAAAGANAYVVKRDFNPAAFIAQVEETLRSQ